MALEHGVSTLTRSRLLTSERSTTRNVRSQREALAGALIPPETAVLIPTAASLASEVHVDRN